jgi:hypothetical protein
MKRTLGLAMATALLLAACGGDDTSSSATATSIDDTAAVTTSEASTTAPETSPPTTALPSTTDAPTTTEAPTTTAAPTTTEAPLTVADLLLSGNAIGPVAFGTSVQASLDVLVPLLGAPATDVSATFPTTDESGSYINEDDESIFAFPFLRRTCFDNGYCMAFGGPSVEELQFVGYDYYSAETPAPPVLTTTEGVPLAARWSDHLAGMDAFGGGCYGQGTGDSGGVTLVLLSSGEFFGTFDGETYTTAVPDPADVTVYGMYSGSNPGYLYNDC